MNILIIDDHLIFGQSLQALLYTKGVESTVLTCCEDALQRKYQNLFDIVLIDFYLKEIAGFEALKKIKDFFIHSKIIVISAEHDKTIISTCIKNGASGFIVKSSSVDVLVSAIELISKGGTYLPSFYIKGNHIESGDKSSFYKLSKRQKEILDLVTAGKPNKIIADELNIAEGTVKAHVSAIYKVLGVKSRTEAVIYKAKYSL